VSFLELYNEEIRDLLAKNTKKLDIREKESGVYVKDLSKFIIQNA
jgi:kinesin family protein 3/17